MFADLESTEVREDSGPWEEDLPPVPAAMKSSPHLLSNSLDSLTPL